MSKKFPILNDKTWLEHVYHVENKSILDIAKIVGCNHLTVHRSFLKLAIKKRTQSESRRLVQSKTEATCFQRYGAINPLSKGTVPEKQRNETVKNRYGVSNVFQYEPIKSANITRMKTGGDSNEKRLNTLQRRFGYRSPFACSKVRKKIIQSFLSGSSGRHISNLNRKAYEILQKHNIEYEPEFLIGNLSYDLCVRKSILIELNGDHPHANPIRFSANDVVLMPGQRYFAYEVWKHDAKKAQLAVDQGYKFITLWENELKYDFESVLLKAIKTYEN